MSIVLAPENEMRSPLADDREQQQTEIRIVLADDHAVVRSGLRLLLEREPGFEVVAEAGDIAGARRYARGHHPNVVILDLNMPGLPTLEAIPELRRELPGTRIVVLTMEEDPASARAALAAGAAGYVLKDSSDTELVQAVRHAASGDTYLSPRLGAQLAAAPPAAAPDELSDRELEVLRLIALGHTNTEIARKLFISVRTVESHRARIQHKLGLATRAELVGYAIERGLLSDART